jgi:Tfp pilus assembly protein FimT
MKRMIAILSVVLAFTATVYAQAPEAQQNENLSKKQLNSLIATAKTPAQHQRIAHYYSAQSDSYLAQSKEHAQMAEGYKANPAINNGKFSRGTVGHCEYLAQSFKEMSTKAGELAQMHEQMAKDAQQK